MKIRSLIGSIGRALVRYSGRPATQAPPEISPFDDLMNKLKDGAVVIPDAPPGLKGIDRAPPKHWTPQALGAEIRRRMAPIEGQMRGMDAEDAVAMARRALEGLPVVVGSTPGHQSMSISSTDEFDAASTEYEPHHEHVTSFVTGGGEADDNAAFNGPSVPWDAIAPLRREVMGTADDRRWSFGRFATRTMRSPMATWMIGVTRDQFGIYMREFYCCSPIHEGRMLSALIHLPSGTGLGLFLNAEAARNAAEIAMNMHGIDWLKSVDPLNPTTWERDTASRLATAWRSSGIVPAPFHAHEDGQDHPLIVHMQTLATTTNGKPEKLS